IGALAAVALSTLLEGAQDPGLGGVPLKVIAGVVAVAFAFWRKDMLLTIIVGMLTYHVVRWTI
ncbi:MAG TPA: AzlD domain-containing protein, partial [Aquabacterium sp.]|nr:AzlD domain-containing protein [Aquabacterium sp.]